MLAHFHASQFIVSGMSIVFLIGVDHSIQHDGLPGVKSPPLETLQLLRHEFTHFLLDTASSVNADCIAEEFNNEAVISSKASNSIAQIVADRLRINHIFSDPNTELRKKLGIDKAPKEKAFEVREKYWLNSLSNCKCKQFIFIVGASHLISFDLLLKSSRYSTKILAEYYKREHFES